MARALAGVGGAVVEIEGVGAPPAAQGASKRESMSLSRSLQRASSATT